MILEGHEMEGLVAYFNIIPMHLVGKTDVKHESISQGTSSSEAGVLITTL
jgi:hypothetical protein